MLQGINGLNLLWQKISSANVSKDIKSSNENQADTSLSSGVPVTLSIEAKSINLKAQDSLVVGDWSKTYGSGGVLHKFNSQLISDGENAEFLKQSPDSDDPSRLDLAKQAVDFLLKKDDNPFANTSRETLSRIAFDESGAFTHAERFAAILETSSRDNDYANRVYEQQQQAKGGDTARYMISIASKLQLASGMGAEEKAMHNLSEAALSAELDNYVTKLGVNRPSPVLYENLVGGAETILSATTDSAGKAVWSELSVKDLVSDKTTISFNTSSGISDLLDSLELGSNKKWITMYAHIDQMK